MVSYEYEWNDDLINILMEEWSIKNFQLFILRRRNREMMTDGDLLERHGCFSFFFPHSYLTLSRCTRTVHPPHSITHCFNGIDCFYTSFSIPIKQHFSIPINCVFDGSHLCDDMACSGGILRFIFHLERF